MTGASVHGLGRGLRRKGGVPFAVSRIFATFIDESKTPLQMKRLLLLFFCFLFAGAVRAADYRFERDILYRTDASGDYARRMCRLDVACPPDAEDAPVVVWFHGGGITGGKRAVPEGLMKKGFVVVGVGYRLIPHVGTLDIVDDAAAAVAWVFDHIADYGGSPSKIYIAGHSAGGYLVNMVGLDRSRLARYGKDADSLAGIIPFSGHAITHFAARKALGMSALQPLVDDTAPLYYVRPDCAPMLILSGDRELEMNGRYEETAYFWRMMRLVGHEDVTLCEFDGYDHGNMPAAGYPVAVRFICRLEGIE